LWALSAELFPSWVFVTFFFKGVYKKSAAEKASNDAAARTHIGDPAFAKINKLSEDSISDPLIINH
jgi:hypothetical protein